MKELKLNLKELKLNLAIEIEDHKEENTAR